VSQVADGERHAAGALARFSLEFQTKGGVEVQNEAGGAPAAATSPKARKAKEGVN
jgi:hypothetical protein